MRTSQEVEHELRLSTHIRGEPTHLPDLRSAVSDWLTSIGVKDESRQDLVLAAHEMAAEAIERGASEVEIRGEVTGDAIRLGGWWRLAASTSCARPWYVRSWRRFASIGGIVTMRMRLIDVCESGLN